MLLQCVLFVLFVRLGKSVALLVTYQGFLCVCVRAWIRPHTKELRAAYIGLCIKDMHGNF